MFKAMILYFFSIYLLQLYYFRNYAILIKLTLFIKNASFDRLAFKNILIIYFAGFVVQVCFVAG
jgi:hypothetical protein